MKICKMLLLLDWKYAYQTDIDGYQVHMEILDSLTMVSACLAVMLRPIA